MVSSIDREKIWSRRLEAVIYWSAISQSTIVYMETRTLRDMLNKSDERLFFDAIDNDRRQINLK